MKNIFTLLFLFVSLQSFCQSANLVISQVYGGAGCMTAGCATYKNDFIEIYNRGTNAVSLNGLSVQYGSATSNGITINSGGITILSDISVQPGKYFLIAENGNDSGVNELPVPDATGTISMSATNGKVFLVNGTTGIELSETGCPVSPVIDFVGYGTANCAEGTATNALSTTTSAMRDDNGNTDTDMNADDFTIGAPIPRNSTYFPAPVTLLNFSIRKNGDANQLHWQVNCISTSVTFEMQRSTDGVQFESIYKSAETKARCATPFDYNDADMLNGKNYYRLKITDIDGTISFSKIVMVTTIKNGSIISVFPTITSNHVTVVYDAADISSLKILITDLQGRVVRKLTVSVANGENNININVSNLSPGQYYMKAFDKTTLPVMRIIKQ